MKIKLKLLSSLLALYASANLHAMGKPLVVCLEQESPPYSTEAGGIDNRVALAVADGMGLPLSIHWYETEGGDEGNPALQINALLSSNRCELAGGFALTQNNFAAPGSQTFLLENSVGQRQRVALKPLAPSLAYHAQAYTLIWSSAATGPIPTDLDEFENRAILVEENSVADLILMAHRGGLLRKSIRHAKVGAENLFTMLAAGGFDGVWAPQHQFEEWQRHQAESTLIPSGLIHDFSINLGFAALKTNYQLLDRVDEIIETLIDDGNIEAIFAEHKLSYRAPSAPLLMPPLSARLLTPQ